LDAAKGGGWHFVFEGREEITGIGVVPLGAVGGGFEELHGVDVGGEGEDPGGWDGVKGEVVGVHFEGLM